MVVDKHRELKPTGGNVQSVYAEYLHRRVNLVLISTEKCLNSAFDRTKIVVMLQMFRSID
ncbi:hypothetical protein BLOT_007479 [Blomia tropicalis]|nr:hypothetical protein BLOT_007479 [Blomia tropicalis]